MAIGVDKLLLPWANYNRLWAWLNIVDSLWPMIVYSRQSGKIWQPPSAKLNWSCCRCCKALHADIDGFPFLRSPARRFHSASGVGATKYNRFRNPIPDRSPLSAQLFQMNNLSGAAQKKGRQRQSRAAGQKKKKNSRESRKKKGTETKSQLPRTWILSVRWSIQGFPLDHQLFPVHIGARYSWFIIVIIYGPVCPYTITSYFLPFTGLPRFLPTLCLWFLQFSPGHTHIPGK